MSIYDTHKPKTGSGMYLKLEDGDTAKIRIAGEPAIFETENERDGKISISTRYAWVVWNQDNQTAQIMQQSATFFKSIANLAKDEEYGDPTGYDIKITRSGSGTDTNYTVVPSANRQPLTKEAKEAVAAIDLVGKLEASPYAQHVMWLEEFESGAKPAAKKAAAKAAKAAEPTDDEVIEDVSGDPINLDDIPF